MKKYTNDKNEKIEVISDDDFNELQIETLKDSGIHFVSFAYFEKEDFEDLFEVVKNNLSTDKNVKKLINFVFGEQSRVGIKDPYLWDFVEMYNDETNCGYTTLEDLCKDKKEYENFKEELPYFVDEVLSDLIDDYDSLEHLLEYVGGIDKNLSFIEFQGYSQGEYYLVWSLNSNIDLKKNKKYITMVVIDSWKTIVTADDGDYLGEFCESIDGYYSLKTEKYYDTLNNLMKKEYNVK